MVEMHYLTSFGFFGVLMMYFALYHMVVEICCFLREERRF